VKFQEIFVTPNPEPSQTRIGLGFAVIVPVAPDFAGLEVAGALAAGVAAGFVWSPAAGGAVELLVAAVFVFAGGVESQPLRKATQRATSMRRLKRAPSFGPIEFILLIGSLESITWLSATLRRMLRVYHSNEPNASFAVLESGSETTHYC
jgi:hypothetical protein